MMKKQSGCFFSGTHSVVAVLDGASSHLAVISCEARRNTRTFHTAALRGTFSDITRKTVISIQGS